MITSFLLHLPRQNYRLRIHQTRHRHHLIVKTAAPDVLDRARAVLVELSGEHRKPRLIIDVDLPGVDFDACPEPEVNVAVVDLDFSPSS